MSETSALRALMEADRWIDRVAAQQTHLPEAAELTALEGQLRTLLGRLRDTETAAAPLRQAFDEVDATSARLRTRAHELAATLAASTANARELAALEHEVTHVRELLRASEDRELELMEQLEPLDATLATIRADAQPGVARRGELTATIAELRSSLDEEMAARRAARDALASVVTPALRSRYDAALARVGTSGAAQVHEGRCDGCRLALAPLDLDRFKAQAADTFMDCPECGRLLLP